MNALQQTLAERLAQRKSDGLYRQRKTIASAQGESVVVDGELKRNFCSNDYLGLAAESDLTQAMVDAAKERGCGSGASHLVCGHSDEHENLERELAEFLACERVLLFSTGYMANLGIHSALVSRGDAVFGDKLNHASLIDGALLSRAKFQRFKHNDCASLERALAVSTASNKLIAVDSVFSMDGDIAPLPELSELAEHYGAWLMADDAHGFGVLGHQGRGCRDHFGLSGHQLPIVMGTLGKALGGFGAFVAGSQLLIESLIQFAKPYIYTTALPPAVAAANRAGLRLLQSQPWRHLQLQQNITFFRQQAEQLNLPLMPSETAIQPLLIGDTNQAMALSTKLEQKGFWVAPIRPPTVPVGMARLRITLSAAHQQSDIQALLDALAELTPLSV